MVGFGGAFYAILSGLDVPEFSGFGETAVTMYRGLLGDFDFAIFDLIESEALRAFTVILFCMYLGMAAIVLLNLLIAMMSDTYSAVQDVSVNEYIYGKARLTWVLDINSSELPPPFNMVVRIIFVIFLLLRGFYRCFFAVYSRCCRHGHNHSTEVVEALDDIVPMNQLGIVEPTQYAAFSEEGAKVSSGCPTSRENMEWPWICAHCHCENEKFKRPPVISHYVSVRRFSNSLGHSATRDSRINKHATVLTEGPLVSGDTVVCFNCWRVAHPIERWVLVREKISFIVFIAILWLPLIFCLVLPYGIFLLVDRLVAALNIKEDMRKKRVFHEVVDLPKKNPEEIHESENRVEYIHNLFENEPVTIEDLSKDLKQLKDDLADFTSGRHFDPKASLFKSKKQKGVRFDHDGADSDKDSQRRKSEYFTYQTMDVDKDYQPSEIFDGDLEEKSGRYDMDEKDQESGLDSKHDTDTEQDNAGDNASDNDGISQDRIVVL